MVSAAPEPPGQESPFGDADAQPSVGSVASEAARLVQVLAGQVSTRVATHADPPSPAGSEDVVEEPQHEAEDPVNCAECGGQINRVCAACPICRASGLVQLFSPPVLDAVADLAGAAARALRHAAARQRQAGGWHVTRHEPEPDPWSDADQD